VYGAALPYFSHVSLLLASFCALASGLAWALGAKRPAGAFLIAALALAALGAYLGG